MSWLKDRWEEVTAQVKMGDNRTASTVRAARAKAAPATTRVNTNQPGWSVRKPQSAPLTTQQRVNQSYGPVGFSGFKNYLKDYVDPNTEADRIRRAATTGLNESYDQEQDRLTKQAQASNDKLDVVHQGMKSISAGVADFVGKTPGSIGQMQGRVAKTVNDINNPVLRTGAKALTAPFGGLMTDKQADYNIKFGQGLNSRVQNKLQQSAFGDRADDNKWVTGAGKMVGQLGGQIATGGLGTAAIGSQMAADEANKAQAAGKSNTYSTLTGLGQGGLGALSEKFGVDRFLPGNNVTGNTVTKLLKRGLTEGAQEVQQQFTQNLIANKAYNPEQGLKDGLAESFVMGGLAGGAMSPAVDIMNRPTAPKPTTSLVSKPAPTRIIKPTTNLVQRGKSELATGLNTLNRGANQYTPYTQLVPTASGRQIVSPRDSGRVIRENLNELGEKASELKKRLLPPLNDGGYISLGAPEPKKLPQDIKDQFSKQGSFGREAMDRLEANKISKGDLERAGVVFDPKQVKKIAQTLPEFKANPVMTYRKGDYSYTDAGYGRYPVPEKARSGVFEFKHSRGTMRLNPEALFGKEMAQKLAQTAKDGEQVDFTDTMKASGNRLFTYNQTPDSTVLNRKEPKLNSVEQKVTETEPKRTEIDKDTQMITSIAEPTAKVQKPSNIKESDNSVTVSYGSKGSVNIYRKADGTIGTTTDGLGGNAPSYTKNALELPEVKSKFAQPDPLESLKQEARKYKSAEEFRKNLVYNDNIIIHQTGKSTADKIKAEGFKSGKETGLGEKRSEVYGMTAYDWNKHSKFTKDTYARDGSDVAEVAIDTKGLKIADRTKQKFTDEEYVKGIHKQIPDGYDGVKVGYGNGVNEVLLKPEVASARRFNIDDLYTQSQPPKSTAIQKVAKADHWTTPLPDDGKRPPITAKDTNGVIPKEGDVIEFPGALGGKGRTTVHWQGPVRANASGKEIPGQWIGNGVLREDSPIPFTVVERNGKPLAPQPTKVATPFEQNLQTAGLAPKKAKGLVVSETKPLNGQKIQKVRTAPGEVEQRVVQDRSDEIADALGMTQDQREPSFNAVAAAKNSSSAKRLVEALNMNDDITQAAAQAQQDGKEINFFAKKDANGRSVGVERFDPQYHKIDAGFVTDRNGNVLGNHIKVDSTGVQVNVGGDLVNMDRVLGNPIDWGNKYEASSTMERNIYQNAPTKEIADKTYKFTVGHKIQSEANYKTELQQQRKALADRTKATLAAKPRRIKSEEYKADLFDFIENTSTYTDMVAKYGETTAKVMSDYKTSTRTLYNDLLKRVNEQFGKFGMEQVPQRKDYLTHINELMDKKSYVGELVGQLQNSIADEGKGRTRGAIPTDIAGRSENFKPTKKWNRFFQERRGGEFTKDPFKAVDAYLEPTLHNIHMTESGVRTRAVEATFRTVSQLKNMDTSYVQKELGDSLVKFKVQGGNDKLVRGFQEYANAITGKTESLDRQIIDKSDAFATALRGWQKLQSVGGRATILGNLNSVLMQPLNQIATMAQTNPANYLKGIAATISGDKTYQQSPFLKARNAKVDSYFRSKGQKFLDKGAVPLELVEKAAIRNTWNAQYQSVLKDGYKGKEAITETDRRTERTVAGRGIADRPELYRSTLANGVLQYTLEMNAQNKMFWRDLTPVQKAEFMVASSGVNMILGAVTGNTPMPDFIKAMFDSVMDFADGEDDDSVLENAGQAVQRVAGEAASMNPLVSAGANLLPKSARQVAFGKESDLGRYDGTSAPIQVVKNVVDTGSKLAQGKYTDARNSALKTVPFGNQIQKTWRGAEAISDGKTEGSPWQAAKALAFGPNAINTDTAKETRFSATPSKSKGKVNASSVDGKATFAPTVDEILKAQFSTKEQKAWLKLSAADRKAEAEQDPEKAKWLKQYEATKRVNKNAPERPEGLSKESETILNWHNKRTPQQREKLAYTQNDYDYKLATAQFEEAKLNGTVSRAEMINKQQALAKAKVGKDFTKDTRESYNSLSKAELTTLAENDPNGKQIMADAIAYGDALVKAGLIKKNKLRTGSGSGGRGSKGGSKYDYTKNLFASSSDSASTSKQLRAILEKAMSGKS